MGSIPCTFDDLTSHSSRVETLLRMRKATEKEFQLSFTKRGAKQWLGMHLSGIKKYSLSLRRILFL